jgi:hypothetical protein
MVVVEIHERLGEKNLGFRPVLLSHLMSDYALIACRVLLYPNDCALIACRVLLYHCLMDLM